MIDRVRPDPGQTLEISENGQIPTHALSPSRFSRPLLARLIFYGVVSCLLIGASLYIVRTDRDNQVAATKSNNLMLANLLTEHFAKIFNDADSTIGLVAANLAEHAGDSTSEQRLVAKRIKANIRDVLAISLIGSDGGIIWTTWDELPPGSFVQDRPYFQRLAAGAELVIDPPVDGRVTKHRVIPMARRLVDQHGNFTGAILAHLDEQYFADFLSRTTQTSGTQASLFRLDGTLLMRHPEMRIGDSFPDWPLAHQPVDASEGSLQATSPIDDVERLVSFSRVPDYPLVVHVSVGLDQSLQHWRQSARRVALLATLSLLALLGFAIYDVSASRRLRRVTEQLHRNDAHFRMFADNIDEVYWIGDPNFSKARYVNAAFETMFDLPVQAMLDDADRLFERIHPADRAHARFVMNSCQSAGLPHRVEYRVETAAGDIRWILDKGFPVRNWQGDVTHYVGTCVDITAQKNSMIEIQALNERITLATNSVGIGIWEWDLVQDVVRWDKVHQGLYGMNSEEFVCGRADWLSLLEGDDAERDAAEFQRALTERSRYSNIYRIRLPSRRTRILQVEGVIERDALGNPSRALGVSWDVTEAETARAAILDARAELRAIMENTVDGLITIDADSKILSFSAPATRIFGYRAEDVIGRKFDCLLSPADGARLFGSDKNSAVDSVAKISATSREVTGCRKDGVYFPVDLTIAEIADFGAGRRFVCTVRDISAQKQNEQRLMQSQRIDAIGQLAAGIAHDFNNFLAAILEFASFLSEDLPADSQPHKFACHILDAGERAKSLVSQILSFARQTDLATEIVDLGPIIAETAGFLVQTLGASTTFHLDFTEERLVCKINPGQINQILVNLCLNSHDALQGQPGWIRITLDKIEKGRDFASILLEDDARTRHFRIGQPDQSCSYGRLTVTDDGPGIPHQILDKIFDPFFTTKDRSRGTGLGLAVLHGIVLSYDGWCEVTSRLGVGTSFAVYFKLEEESSAPIAETQRIAPLRQGHEQILVVDDEPDIVEALTTGLSRFGYLVEGISDPLAAVLLFEDDPTRWDVVISDQAMPNMTGLTLLARLKRLSPRLHTILCTGYSDGGLEAMAQEQHLSQFFLKPVSSARLAEAIRGMVRDRVDTL